MAYVAVSQTTLDQIKANIDRMSRTELASVPTAKLSLVASDCDLIERDVWGEHYELLPKMPKQWTRKAENVAVKFVRQASLEPPLSSFNEIVNVTAPRKICIPPEVRNGSNSYSYSYSYVHYGEGGDIFINASILDAALTAPVYDVLAMRQDIVDRWKKVRNEVTQFLESAKSLNEALKLWPQLEIYVPKSLMEKVMEKRTVTKGESKAAEMLKQMDVDAAVASATLARMAQAQAGAA